MATSKDFSRSTFSSSEEVFDIACTLCAEKNIHKESSHFCVECMEYLCSECLTDHKWWPVMAGHAILGKEEFSSIDRVSSLPTVPTERCSVHPTKVIEMYCGTHDQVACTVCSVIDHKSCNDVHYIPDVAHKLDTHQARQCTKAALIKASDEMKNLKTTLNVALNEINDAKESTLRAIRKFRTELNQILDELEKTTKQDLEKQCQLIDTQLQSNIEQVSSNIQDLQKRLDKLKLSGRSDSQQFALTKMSMKTISIAENISSEIHPSSVQFTFLKNLVLKRYLEQLQSLGEISTRIQKPILRAPDPITTQGVYKVKEAHHVSMHIDDDDFICSIWGSCVLDSGALLLADFTNHKLKLFDTYANTVKSHCKMPDAPIAVCNLNVDEVIASLQNQTIHFISIADDQIIPTKKLQMHHECYGLAFAVDQLYITDTRKSLYIHAKDGQLLRIINTDQSGNQIFSGALHVTASNNKIYVSDYGNGLITLNKNGQVMWRFSDFDLDAAYGVCTDGCGNVFVCDLDSNNVLQLGHDGKRLGIIVDKSHGLSCPRSICFDSKHSTLIISQERNDNLLLVTLQ